MTPCLLRPLVTVLGIIGLFVLSLALYPLIGKAYFPAHGSQPVRHQRQGALGHAPRIDGPMIGQVEDIVREVVPQEDLKIIVSNIGITPGFYSILTPQLRPAHGRSCRWASTKGTNSAASTTWTWCGTGWDAICRK